MLVEMRRKDKEKSPEEARRILRESPNGIVSVVLDTGYPYGVPVSHVYEKDCIYFHSAVAGRKYQALIKNPKVCFTAIGKDEPQPGKFTTLYSSAIAFGTACLVEDEDEAEEALIRITQKYDVSVSEESIRKYIQAYRSATCVFKITVEQLTGKGLA